MKLCVLWLFGVAVFAQDPVVQKSFDHFYNLEYDQAVAGFGAAIAVSPNNPQLYNHLAQSIQFREMYRSGALESELVTRTNPFLRRPKMNVPLEDQKRFQDAIAMAMALAQARIDRNPKDAEALYSLGVSYGLRSNHNFLVRKAWMDSLHDATNARKYANRALQADPGFVDARLIQGTHDYIVGSLPFTYKILGFLAGFRGDREGGIRTLQLVAHQGKSTRADAEVLLSAIYRREGRLKDAVPLLGDLIHRYPRNYLLRLELGQMYAEAGDKNSALAVFADVDKLQRGRAPGYDRFVPEKVCYLRGSLMFWYQDPDAAIANLSKAAARTEDLDLNTAVLACLRLGQSYDMAGRREEALKAYRKTIALAPQSDAGREARGYLSSPYSRK